jgi:probable HAF family extracellular repeat protein
MAQPATSRKRLKLFAHISITSLRIPQDWTGAANSMKPIASKHDNPGNLSSGIAGRSTFDVVDLGPFQNNRNNILALNDVGQRAGVSFNEETGRVEAFVEFRGTRRMLGTLGGSFSIARGMNNRGEIVGGSLDTGDDDFHGFLYRNGRLYDLNDLLQPNSGLGVDPGRGHQ